MVRLFSYIRVLLAVLLLLPGLALAQDGGERDTLRGIDVFALQVHCDPALASGRVTEAEITRQVTEKLKDAGIKIGPAEKNLPLLWVCVIATAKAETSPEKSQAVLVAVELLQNVRLARQPSIEVFNRTWADEVLALYTPDKMRGIMTDVKNIVDRFIADYRAVNP